MEYLIPILLVVISLGCQKSDKPFYGIKTAIVEQHPGKKIMEMQCYVCHNPATPEENRIAPPMIAIKNHYKKIILVKKISSKKFKNLLKTDI